MIFKNFLTQVLNATADILNFFFPQGTCFHS